MQFCTLIHYCKIFHIFCIIYKYSECVRRIEPKSNLLRSAFNTHYFSRVNFSQLNRGREMPREGELNAIVMRVYNKNNNRAEPTHRGEIRNVKDCTRVLKYFRGIGIIKIQHESESAVYRILFDWNWMTSGHPSAQEWLRCGSVWSGVLLVRPRQTQHNQCCLMGR